MKRKIAKHKIILSAVALVLLVLLVWTLWGNTALEISEFTVSSERIPKNFDGYRIVQISDLHNAEFGTDNGELLKLLSDTNPDIILITGDMIDSRRTNIEVAISFCKRALDIAPCYYVTGNHEARIGEYAELEKEMISAGVIVLRDAITYIERSGEQIALLGLDDPSFQGVSNDIGGTQGTVDSKIKGILEGNNTYTLLLSHRPELFDVYCDNSIDLVFSGHAHGGQIRLPFAGGLFAPNQGMFPKYDSGLYSSDHTNMLVSRGLGNSIIPLRFHNRPEIVVVTLESNG